HPGTAAVSGTSGMLGAPATGGPAHVDQPTRHPSQRGRTGRHAVLRAGQPAAHHQARSRPTHRRRQALGQRRALTGEPLAPQLTATATAQRQGLIGEAHVKVIRALFRPPARRGGCVHPPGRRSRPGRQSRSISSRRAGPLRPAGHGLATPRRRPHRHRTRPQTRHHPEQPAIRRHVTAKWLPDPPSAGHL
ncbi:hypothetical protein N109_03566, partial [Mycobacterium tuberculosis variant africanum MAL020173]